MKIFAGSSWSKGFEISLYERKKNISIKVESKENSVEEPDKLSVIKNFWKRVSYLFRILLLIFIFFHCLFFWRNSILVNIFSIVALMLFAHSTAVLIIGSASANLTTRQWHSCEHKLISLLKKIIKKNSVQDLTISNLKKQIRIHWGCSTTGQALFPLLFFGSYLLTLVTPIKFLLLPFGLYIYFGAVKAILGTVMLIFVSFPIGLVIQFIFRTAKPTQEQLEETMRVGREFLKKYKELTNGSSN